MSGVQQAQKTSRSSEILDVGFDFLRRRLWSVLGFQAALRAPFLLLLWLSYRATALNLRVRGGAGEVFLQLGVLAAGTVLLGAVVRALAYVGLAGAVGERLGLRWGARQLWRCSARAAARAVPYGGLLGLGATAIASVPVAATVALGGWFASGGGSGRLVAYVFGTAFVGAVALLAASWFVVRFSFAGVLIASGDDSLFECLRRSPHLLRACRPDAHRLFMILAAIIVFGWMLASLFVSSPSYELRSLPQVRALLPALIMAQANSLIAAEVPAAFTEAYAFVCWALLGRQALGQEGRLDP